MIGEGSMCVAIHCLALVLNSHPMRFSPIPIQFFLAFFNPGLLSLLLSNYHVPSAVDFGNFPASDWLLS